MDNRTRLMNETISIDGWIGEFDADGKAKVHVDVVFRQGSFGDDPNSPIRFKVALTRAEIVVRVPDNEPINVVKRSIDRTVDSLQATQSVQHSKRSAFKRNFKAMFSKLGIGADAEASASVEAKKETDLQYQRNVTNFIAQHFTTPDSHPAWEFSTNTQLSKHLTGAPWDPLEQSRMKVRRSDGDAPKSGSVSVVIEVRCAREDILILDLQEKDPDQQRLFKTKKNSALRIAAAEQLIKEELFKAGFLEVPDLSEKHARLLIADKIILEEED